VKCVLKRAFLTALAAFACLSWTPAIAAEPAPRVLAIELDNDINPVTQDFVEGELERAAEENYDAAAILLDTPGGLTSSMEGIVKAELAAPLPVIVYVSPSGGAATSAGAFIAQAADVLAMAPNTTIGSATPVAGEGQNLNSDLRRKAINKYAAQMRGLAETHGRNAAWADAAVRRGANLPAEEAVERNVADLLAPDLPTLLNEVDGWKPEPKGLVLNTAGATIDTVELSLWKRLLDTLIDPNIILLMMSIGLIGIVVELWNPGLVFPGAVGGISLIVGLYGLQVLPISWAGLLLMLLAAGFLVAEVFVVSHGALAVAGGICFVIGSLMLFDPAGDAYQVSLPVALAIAATLAGFMAIVVTKIVQVRRRPVEVGLHSLVGERVRVRREGYVLAHGELWRARAAEGGPLVPGEEVEVLGVGEDLVLAVQRVGSADPAPAPVA
jgi:membrane-bound serine protease (ClpP class)